MKSPEGSNRFAPACNGASGARTSPSASGAPSARTTANRATPGATSATTRRDRARIDGRGRPRGRLRRSAAAVLRPGGGNGVDPILKERLFGLTNAEGTTARTSRSTTSTSTRRRRTRIRYLAATRSGVSHEDLIRPTGRARTRHVRVRAGRHGDFRRQPGTSTSSSSAKAGPEDLSSSSPRTTAVLMPPRCTCCRRSGSAGRGSR
jgi:hypothetical protein